MLFSGDLVGEKPAWYAPTAGGVTGYLASLDAIADLQPTALLPSHAPPIRDPQRAIAAIRQELLGRERRLLERIRRGAASFKELVDALFSSHFALFPGCSIVESHLQKLMAEGVVVERDGRYQG